MTKAHRVAVATALVTTLGACATPRPLAFDVHSRGSSDSAWRAVATVGAGRDVAERVAPPQVVLAVTTSTPVALVAFDFEHGHVRWRTPWPHRSQPEVLGDLVLGTVGRKIVALELTTGQVRWHATLPDESYLGAARSAGHVFTTTHGEGVRARGHVIALDARTGATAWSREAPGPLGRPAASGGLVWIPWQRQSLVALDGSRGHEVGRWRARDHAIEWVLAHDAGVEFGDRVVMRLDRRYDGSLASSARLAFPVAELPGSPALQPSAYAPLPDTQSVAGRIGVTYALARDAPPRLRDGTYYFHFYRAVFAFDEAGRLAWCRTLDTDVVAARPVPGGLVTTLTSGQVLVLRARDGSVASVRELGERITTAALTALTPIVSDAPRTPGLSLREALRALALDRDARLLPVRAFAARRLGVMPDGDATRDLLDIYSADGTPPELARAAVDAMQERGAGTEHLLAALERRPDFLAPVRPAPLSVIVPMLVRLRETRALDSLVAWLNDPQTPVAALPGLVEAISSLGGVRAVRPLDAFLRRYRADSALAQAPAALVEAARAVLVHGGAEGRARLIALAGAPRTLPPLAAGLTSLLARNDAAPRPDTALAASPTPDLPEILTREDLRKPFLANAPALRACVGNALRNHPDLTQVRFAFIVEHDGTAHAWSFVPNQLALVDCLSAVVRDYQFPVFRRGRRVATFLLAVRPQTTRNTPARIANEPWWKDALRRTAAGESEAEPAPWWREPEWAFVRVEAPGPRGTRFDADAHDETRESRATPDPDVTGATGEDRPTPDDRWWLPQHGPAPDGAPAAPPRSP